MATAPETQIGTAGTKTRGLSKGMRSGAALLAIFGAGFTGAMLVIPRGTVPVVAPVTDNSPTFASTVMDLSPEANVYFTSATDTLRRRDTLIDLAVRLGAESRDAYAALQTLYDGEMIDPRRLRPGLSATVHLDQSGEEPVLMAMSVRTAPDHTLFVKRGANGTYAATRLNAVLNPSYIRVAAGIETSIYNAARAGGASDQQVVDFAKVFAYDVDFQREIHPGDTFEIVYESLNDEYGNPVRMGEIVYAELNGKALKRGFYRHTTSDDGALDYFDKAGESATKFLMKTPINGARLSSSFGRRRHPISGYSRLHKGTDFAAPTGTPVYAAGHGTVERASRYGGYGKYVRIRHANGYKTAYAHLSRYGSGVRSGRSVRQGDIIGYVGSTGASTGPHLHYEVLIKGRHVNAMRLNFPTGRKLAETPAMMAEFEAKRAEIDRIRRDLGAETDVAALPTSQMTHN